MRITILTVPDCPNAPVAAGRITAALAGRPASVELVEVTGEAEAARLGMTGSPTILLDGVDPFAAAGAVPGVSCRIYRGSDGAAAGAPSVQDLTAALSRRLPGATGDEGCEADVPDPVGRAGRGRRAPAAGGLRAVHQAVLRHFAATGSGPGPETLEAAAARYRRTAGEVLAELDREDFLTLGAGREDPCGVPVLRHPDAAPRADRRRRGGVVDVRDRRAGHPGHARPRRRHHLRGPGDRRAGHRHRRPGPHHRLAARRHGGIHRQPQLPRPGRHGLLRRPQLLHQHSLGTHLGARAPGRDRQ